MKLWAWLFALIAAAVLAAFGWHWLADDPGYVMLRLRGTTIETTGIFALLCFAAAWLVLAVLWRLARWPLRRWRQRARRRSRERMASGLIALAEGRYARAEKELWKATHYSELRAPALLAAARAALGQEAGDRVDAALNEAAETAPAAALALRARLLREQSRQAEAYALLKEPAASGSLAPAAWVEFVDAALATGDVDAAHRALEPVARSQSLPQAKFDALEARVLAAAFVAQRSADAANTLWAGLSRSQRRKPGVLAAYARSVALQGQPLPGMSEIEAALRREWNELAVTAYAELGPVDATVRLRTAEGWLSSHPNSTALLTTLGRLCVEMQLWGKAHDYLERSLGIEPSVLAWQTLGDCCMGENDPTGAARCYRNALRLGAGESTEMLPQRGPRRALATQALIVEERSAHGVPRLPDTSH
jgi:HemY protein